MYKIFMDTETSGLDHLKHQILTIAVVVTKDREIVFKKEWAIKKQEWSEINDYALKVNGIDLEEHENVAKEERVVLSEINGVVSMYGLFRPLWHGHNVSFDIGFVNAMYKRNSMKNPFSYHFNDTMILALALKDAGKLNVSNVKLGTICSHFGFSTDFHKALEDTEATAKIYFKMIDIICQSSKEVEK